MAWDWDKLQDQKKNRAGGGASHPPPNLNEIFEKIGSGKGKIPGGLPLLVIIFIIIFLGLSCFYTVGVDEVGIIQRFGEYVRETPPGLHFKFPTGIEKVTKVKVKKIDKEEFGFRTLSAGIKSRFAPSSSYEGESLMLTGDLNVAIVPWIVQYRINDPYKYLFKVDNVNATLRDLAESTMRMVVGDRSIDEVISKREEIASQGTELLQKELDFAETGIKVVAVEMKKTDVPEPVQPSFNQVNQAVQEREKLIYQAREAYNKIIPAARGDAEKTIKAAEGYALERVNGAKGDAARFISLYEEYNKAKDITRRRMYLEAMQEIFPKMGKKYLVDSDQKNLLPLLNIGKSSGEK